MARHAAGYTPNSDTQNRNARLSLLIASLLCIPKRGLGSNVVQNRNRSALAIRVIYLGMNSSLLKVRDGRFAIIVFSKLYIG